jgi:hypothetical protein
MVRPPSGTFHQQEAPMRAEIASVAEEIRESLALLRRHL